MGLRVVGCTQRGTPMTSPLGASYPPMADCQDSCPQCPIFWDDGRAPRAKAGAGSPSQGHLLPPGDLDSKGSTRWSVPEPWCVSWQVDRAPRKSWADPWANCCLCAVQATNNNNEDDIDGLRPSHPLTWCFSKLRARTMQPSQSFNNQRTKHSYGQSVSMFSNSIGSYLR